MEEMCYKTEGGNDNRLDIKAVSVVAIVVHMMGVLHVHHIKLRVSQVDQFR